MKNALAAAVASMGIGAKAEDVPGSTSATPAEGATDLNVGAVSAEQANAAIPPAVVGTAAPAAEAGTPATPPAVVEDPFLLDFKTIYAFALSEKAPDAYLAGTDSRRANPLCFYLTTVKGYPRAGLNWTDNPEKPGKKMMIVQGVKADGTGHDVFRMTAELNRFASAFDREKQYQNSLGLPLTKESVKGMLNAQIARSAQLQGIQKPF